MNRLSIRCCAVSLSLGLSFAAYAAPPVAHPKVDKDIEQAQRHPGSLFNDPSAKVINSDTGGHIAVRFQKAQFSDAKAYGERATVEVEVTDPFGYYKKAGGKQQPAAVLGNVASERVVYGHDLNSRTGQGIDLKLVQQGHDPVYRGTGTIEASTRQGDDIGMALGNVGISFAGEKGWNSRFGRTYPVAPAAGWITGKPAVNP